MLTRELAIAEYDFERRRIHPDRLTRRGHAGYVRYAERALRVYREGAGRTRQELHRAVHDVFAREPDCPARRIDAFCKLLDDASRYRQDRHGRAAGLRQQVFRLAAERHPLVNRVDGLFETDEQSCKAWIAEQLGRGWDDIERDLFADVLEYHRLEKFEGFPEPGDLLARYNVAQVQVALYRAESMTVWAGDDFKTILRYAKLARLMHEIERGGAGGYRLRFTGPASILRATRRYGVAMARFVPALIACRDWRMRARIPALRGSGHWRLELSSGDGLHSHLPRLEEFDSEVERAFAARWGEQPRDGWTLQRESEVLHAGQKVFVPDFAFQHADGRRVLLEVVGFWTPEYLRAKVETLCRFREHPLLLAVAERVRDQLPEASSPAGVRRMIPYKTRLKVEDVLERLANGGGQDDTTESV